MNPTHHYGLVRPCYFDRPLSVTGDYLLRRPFTALEREDCRTHEE